MAQTQSYSEFYLQPFQAHPSGLPQEEYGLLSNQAAVPAAVPQPLLVPQLPAQAAPQPAQQQAHQQALAHATPAAQPVALPPAPPVADELQFMPLPELLVGAGASSGGCGLSSRANSGSLGAPPSRQASAAVSAPASRQASLSSGGPKACTQCGATKTPQWREGPAGPKTLCNACGVKRVRAMRTSGDGGKVRRTVPAAPRPASFAFPKAGSPDPQRSTDSNNDYPHKRAKREGSPRERRPQRKAAAKSASRTAEFANTGDWPADDDEAFGQHNNQAQTGSRDSDSGESEHSQSAEELSYAPAPRHEVVPPSPAAPVHAVGVETSAAVNLLSMSVRSAAGPAMDENAKAAAAARGQADGAGPPAQAAPAAGVVPQPPAHSPPPQPQMTQQACAAGYAFAVNYLAKFGYELPVDADAVETVQEVLRTMPAERFQQYTVVKDGAVTNDRNMAAADAAVAAVAKVLAKNQAKATKERATGEFHSKRLVEFLAEECARRGRDLSCKRRRT